MTQGRKEVLFDVDDVDLLAHAVSIFPNLQLACFAAKVARKHLTFPVRSRAELAALLSVSDLPKTISQRRIGKRELETFFPDAYFPIEDVQDLLGKVLGASSYGEVVHHHERFLKDPARYSPVPYRKEK